MYKQWRTRCVRGRGVGINDSMTREKAKEIERDKKG
jgi:hypothetical protein